jgi:hypothetical protein
MTNIAEQGSDFLHDLGEAARRNPVSAVLIGIGALWMLTGGSRTALGAAGQVARRTGLDRLPDVAGEGVGAAGSVLKSGWNSAGQAVSSAADKMQSGAASVMDRATRFGREQADTLSGYVKSAPDSGAEMIGSVRSNLAELFRTQPLALGAVGLAIGAGIAAALPSTEVEAEYFGETSDALKGQAKEFAAEQTERAKTIADSVVDAVSEEARNQGLTIEAAKSAAGDMSSKVKRVLDAASKGASQHAG